MRQHQKRAELRSIVLQILISHAREKKPAASNSGRQKEGAPVEPL
jgi:hypothetical protein